MTESPQIILVRPESSWNIGSVARVASNFSVSRLKLVSPRHFDDVDMKRTACNAPLASCYEVYDSLQEAVADTTSVIGFTGRQSRHRSSHRSYQELFTPATFNVDAKTALCFGPERSGLSNADLEHCSELVFLETNEMCPSMNLAHAVAVSLFGIRLLYESVLQDAASEDGPKKSSLEVAPLASWDQSFELLDEIIERSTALKTTPPHAPGILKRVLRRSMATSYEIAFFRSFLSAIARELRFRTTPD